jgi:hypothetical protein
LNDLDLFLEAINESYVNFEDQIIATKQWKLADELLGQSKLRRKTENLKEVNKILEFVNESWCQSPQRQTRVDYIRLQSVGCKINAKERSYF